MPKLTIDGISVEVPAGKRLVNAIETEGKIDQLHNCGGHAACTSCRVQFVAGEPTKITQAEKDLLAARGLNTTPGLRLSCQLLCDQDMEIKIISRLAGSGRRDVGKPTGETIEPPAVWTTL
jgi:ferredoxin